ncbi:MAG: UMP kinase [Lachnospiraceae bacterium]|nr:UMP kinase [Lachnospiraceae bacterium]
MDKKRRVILKLSGEALAGEKKTGFDEEVVREAAGQIKPAVDAGVELAIVIGGGNFWRGRTSTAIGRVQADQIGMLATVMNCLYVSEIFRSEGMQTKIFTPFYVGDMTELFSKDAAEEALAAGKVVFFAGGTGHPYFSTDTGIVLRAVELGADEILLAKAIDGVYDSDPAINPDAVKFDTLTIDEMVDKQLKVIDLTASIIAMENRMPLAVFGLKGEDSIKRALMGDITGTRVTV